MLISRTRCFAVVLLICVASNATAADLLPRKQHKTGDGLRKLLEPVVKDAFKATTEVIVNERRVAYGTVVNADGCILTKSSLVHQQDEDGSFLPIKCRVEGELIPARVVGVHLQTDLALLKVDTPLPVKAISWKRGEDPQLGSWIVSASPDKLPLAVGVVAVKRRSIGFKPGVLGISVSSSKKKAKVTRITPNSGAARAGLRVGDFVIRIAGAAVTSRSEIARKLKAVRPGDAVLIRVERSGAYHEFVAMMGHTIESVFSRSGIQNQMGGSLSVRRGGFKNVIQHDTVLKPDECGGPVLDLEGRAVGLNIARSGRTSTLMIPTSEILPLIDKLKAGKLPPPKPSVTALRPSPPALPEG